MSHHSSGRSSFFLVLGLVLLCVGCGSEGRPTEPEHKLHSTNNFSSEELNKPLSSASKAKGVKVAPPPTR